MMEMVQGFMLSKEGPSLGDGPSSEGMIELD